VERGTAGAVLRLDGNEANVTLVVAEPGDGLLLGVTALESLGFAVDPVGRRLVPQQLLAM
jgi:predicted aspartyl protease